MSAGKYNINIDQGSTFELTVTISSGGSAKNLTGYSARAKLRLKPEAADSTDFTCTVTNASGGVLTMALTPAQTDALTASRYVYDLEIFTTSDAIVNRVIEGTAEVKRGVTR
tara:strand:+ start:2432 stop:2767 length:336 start_codon:yes stop_codon:yes gene_type:complete